MKKANNQLVLDIPAIKRRQAAAAAQPKATLEEALRGYHWLKANSSRKIR